MLINGEGFRDYLYFGNPQPIPFYENDSIMECAINQLDELETVYEEVMQGLANRELKSYMTEGVIPVLEGEHFDNFKDGLKKIVNTVWNTLTALLNKFTLWIKKVLNNNTKFVKKYEDKFKKANISDSVDIGDKWYGFEHVMDNPSNDAHFGDVSSEDDYNTIIRKVYPYLDIRIHSVKEAADIYYKGTENSGPIPASRLDTNKRSEIINAISKADDMIKLLDNARQKSKKVLSDWIIRIERSAAKSSNMKEKVGLFKRFANDTISIYAVRIKNVQLYVKQCRSIVTNSIRLDRGEKDIDNDKKDTKEDKKTKEEQETNTEDKSTTNNDKKKDKVVKEAYEFGIPYSLAYKYVSEAMEYGYDEHDYIQTKFDIYGRF